VAVVVAAVALLAAGGCARARKGGGAIASPPASAGASATVVSPGQPGGPASPVPAGSAGGAGAGWASAGCLAGVVPMAWMPGQPSPEAVCVHVGSEISVVLHAPELHLWTPPGSSDPAVAVVVGAGVDQEGAAHATVNAVRPGTAVLSAVAQPRDGAPDPRAVPWRLVVTVVA